MDVAENRDICLYIYIKNALFPDLRITFQVLITEIASQLRVKLHTSNLPQISNGEN